MQAEVGGVLSDFFDITLKRNAPGLFSADFLSTEPTQELGFFFLASGQPVTEENPALPNEVVAMFGTGWGPTSPAAVTGGVLAVPAQMIDAATITVGPEVIDEVFYAGLTPATPGLYQGNFRLNATIPPGLQSVVFEAGGESSNAVLLPVGTPSQVLENLVETLEESEADPGVVAPLIGLMRGAAAAMEAGSDGSHQLDALQRLVDLQARRGVLSPELQELIEAQIERVL